MRNLATFLIVIGIASSFFSCKKDKILTDPSAKLRFSQDSVLFDTVFTTIGSTTKYFKVYNDNNQKINISSIRMANGNASQFRFNIDGVSGQSISDIEIDANDSVYVFLEVTVNPTNQNSPLIIYDLLLFDINGKTQAVNLEAWGQDAYYHLPNGKIVFSSGGVLYYEIEQCPTSPQFNCTITWLADKPHVVYGYAVVDSTITLEINAGANIYFHQNAGIWVYRYGTIHVNGTQNQIVTFQGDRLDAEYKDLPGSWDRIWINEGSTGNLINYAILKNGFIGLQHDLLGSDATVSRKLTINNTIIKNMSGWGLFSVHGNIEGYNNVICNCGKNIAAFLLGGSYKFYQCTFANYWNSADRTDPILYVNNYDGVNSIPLDSAYFGNCIFDGPITDEIALDSNGTTLFNFKFENTLLKTALNTSNANRFVFCKINVATSFKDAINYDFKLNSNSMAKDAGKIAIGILYPTDLTGASRTLDSSPDCGAYEY